MHNPFRGETPFPLAGEGVVLRFRTGDLTRLRGKYGAPPTKKPEIGPDGKLVDHFWEILLTGIAVHDPVIMLDVLKAGLKEPGGNKPLSLDWEDLPFSFAEMEEPLQTGLMVSRWGMTPDQLAAQIRAQAEETARLAAESGGEGIPENPTTDLTGTSPTTSESSEPDTDTVSA